MQCYEFEAMRHLLRDHAEALGASVDDEVAIADVLGAYRVDSFAALQALHPHVLDLMADELGALVRGRKAA